MSRGIDQMVLDHSYFAEGVRRCEASLKVYLRRKTGAPLEEVDELHQVILTRAWEKRAEFTGGDLGAWLHHFAAFAALAWHRARGRRVRAAEAFTSHTELLELGVVDGESLHLQRQEFRRLRECLEGLSPTDRQIIDLYYGRGGDGLCLPDREIADTLSRERGEPWKLDRVTKRRARALDHLSRCLEGEISLGEEAVSDTRRRSPLFDLADGMATGRISHQDITRQMSGDDEFREVWQRLTRVEMLLLAEEPPAANLRLLPQDKPLKVWVGGLLSLAAGLALVVGVWYGGDEAPRVLERGGAGESERGEELVVRYQPSEGEGVNLCPRQSATGVWSLGVVAEGTLQVGVPAPEGLPLDGAWSVSWRLARANVSGETFPIEVGEIAAEGLGTDRWLYPRDIRLGSLPGLGFRPGDRLLITMQRGGDSLILGVTLLEGGPEEERWWPICSGSP